MSDLLFNQRVALLQRLLSLRQTGLSNGLQIIDVIQMNAWLLLEGGIDISRHRQVDEDERSGVPLWQDRSDIVGVNHKMRRLCADDGDVDVAQVLQRLLPRKPTALAERRKISRFERRTVHDREFLHTVFHQVSCCCLSSLTRSPQENITLRKTIFNNVRANATTTEPMDACPCPIVVLERTSPAAWSAF